VNPRMKIKWLMFCSAVLSAVLLAGCASGRVYDKNYVRAVAVTGSSAKAAVLAFYDEETEPFASIGSDLDSIIKKTEVSIGKTLFTGHTELIVLGECDYAETLTKMLNEWKVSPSCVVVFGGPYSAYILKNMDVETLKDSIDHAIEQGKAPKSDIVTVLSGLLGDEGCAELASVGEDGFDGIAVIKK